MSPDCVPVIVTVGAIRSVASARVACGAAMPSLSVTSAVTVNAPALPRAAASAAGSVTDQVPPATVAVSLKAVPAIATVTVWPSAPVAVPEIVTSAPDSAMLITSSPAMASMATVGPVRSTLIAGPLATAEGLPAASETCAVIGPSVSPVSTPAKAAGGIVTENTPPATGALG